MTSGMPPVDAARERTRRSRLSRMIERLVTQRVCLEHAAELIRDLPGPVLEIGLGKGRTYDHLRRLLPEREVFAFDRDVHALPGCRPDDAHLVVGELRRTLPVALDRVGGRAALIHADIGSEDRASDVALAKFLAETLPALIMPGGVVLGDRVIPRADWTPLPLPEGIGDWPYFMYRVVTS